MNELQQLAGLILPTQVSWWPIAPGWYLLLAIFTILLVMVILNKRKLYNKNSYRRNALKQLHRLSFKDATDAIPMLSVLQHALNHAMSQHIELQEQIFLTHLNQGIKQISFNEDDWRLLKQFSFQQPQKIICHDDEFSALKTKCQFWIKEHDYEHRV